MRQDVVVKALMGFPIKNKIDLNCYREVITKEENYKLLIRFDRQVMVSNIADSFNTRCS